VLELKEHAGRFYFASPKAEASSRSEAAQSFAGEHSLNIWPDSFWPGCWPSSPVRQRC